MAIQNRRGNIVDLDPYKLLPGEFGISLDNKEARICFAPGDTKTMATKEDFQVQLDNINTNIARAEAAAIAAESLVVNKAGINDLTPTLTEAYSGIKTEQLFNDAKTYSSGLFANVTSFSILIVAELPTTDIQTMTIYLVPKTPSATDNYDEYMYVNSQWEYIGNTEIDLTHYYTKTEVDNKIGNIALNATAEDTTYSNVTSGMAAINVQSAIDELNSEKASKDFIYVNAKDFGAKGDGSTDDTGSIQNAINSLTCGTVIIQNGTFMIKGTDGTPTRDGDKGGIALKSNVNLFIKNATLKVINTNYTDYNLIRCTDIENCTIYGFNGTLQGDKLTNTSSTGEWGFGVGLWNSKNIVIKDLITKEFFGDSIFIGNNNTLKYCENITIDNVVFDNNRRQGVSVCSSKKTTINNCKFSNIAGTSPQAGVDVEPSLTTDILQDTKIVNCSFSSNVIGVNLHGGKNTIVSNCSFNSNSVGAVGISNNNGALIIGCTFRDNPTNISLEVANYNSIVGNTVIGGTTGVLISNTSKYNVISQNNLISVTTMGIQLSGTDENSITNNYFYNVQKGIDLYFANKNSIVGNTINSIGRALSIGGDYNNIQTNRVSGTGDVALGNTGNIFSNNDLLGLTMSDVGTGTIKNNNRT